MHETPPAALRQPYLERSQPSTAGLIALVIWILFAALAMVLATGTVMAFSKLASDPNLPNPRDLEKLGFQEESIIYDRTGKVELARF